jgi:hypothetical protein
MFGVNKYCLGKVLGISDSPFGDGTLELCKDIMERDRLMVVTTMSCEVSLGKRAIVGAISLNSNAMELGEELRGSPCFE